MLFIYLNLTSIRLALIPEQTRVSHTVAARVEPRGKMTHKVLNYSELTEVAFNVPSFCFFAFSPEQSRAYLRFYVKLTFIIIS